METPRSIWTEVGAADVVHISLARELVPIITAITCVMRRHPFVAQPRGMLTARTSRLHQILDLGVRPLFCRSRAVIAFTSSATRSSSRNGPACPKRRRHLPGASSKAQAAGHIRNGGRAQRRALSPRAVHHVRTLPGFGSVRSERQPGVGYIRVLQNGAAHRGGSHTLLGASLRAHAHLLPRTLRKLSITALGLGQPVVITRSSALAPLIRHDGAGIVIPDDDAVALSEAVHLLNTDPRPTKPANDLLDGCLQKNWTCG
jgi:hypothetical protein